MKKSILVTLLIFLVASCSPITKQAKEDLKAPVNCATAEEDIRTLDKEKARVLKEVINGVTAITPYGAAIGILTLSEKDKLEVGFGVYNRKIDRKIAEIERECGLE
jgi:hypothetical protein